MTFSVPPQRNRLGSVDISYLSSKDKFNFGATGNQSLYICNDNNLPPIIVKKDEYVIINTC